MQSLPIEVLVRTIELANGVHVRGTSTSSSSLHPATVVYDHWNAASAFRATCRHARAAVVEWERSITSVSFDLLATPLPPPLVTSARVPQLTYLKLCNCIILPRTFAMLPTQLAHLELHNCYVDENDKVTRRTARSNKRVGDVHISALAKTCPALTHVEVPCTDVSDDAVSELAARCTSLTHVRLSCTHVGDAGIEALAASCGALAHVDVSHTRVSDCSVRALGRQCSHLVHLDVSFCTNVSDDGVRALAAGCPALTHAMLMGTSVGDVGVRSLGRNCSRLVHINVSWCQNVSDVGVCALATGCPELTHVMLLGTSVGDVGLRALRLKCLHITHVNMPGPRMWATSTLSVPTSR